MAQLKEITDFTGYLNGNREVLTQLTLLYRQRLIQGIKSEEMLNDLFVMTSILRILTEYDSSDITAGAATANIITLAEIKMVIDAANCIRVKYGIVVNFDNYILEAEGGLVPLDALYTEADIPILTEAGAYLLTE